MERPEIDKELRKRGLSADTLDSLVEALTSELSILDSQRDEVISKGGVIYKNGEFIRRKKELIILDNKIRDAKVQKRQIQDFWLLNLSGEIEIGKHELKQFGYNGIQRRMEYHNPYLWKRFYSLWIKTKDSKRYMLLSAETQGEQHLVSFSRAKPFYLWQEYRPKYLYLANNLFMFGKGDIMTHYSILIVGENARYARDLIDRVAKGEEIRPVKKEINMILNPKSSQLSACDW